MNGACAYFVHGALSYQADQVLAPLPADESVCSSPARSSSSLSLVVLIPQLDLAPLMSAAYQAQSARAALTAAGAAWLTAHLKAHPREHDEIQREHDVWVKDIEPLTDDFFQWPRYFKTLFWQILDELVAVCQGRAHGPEQSGDLVSSFLPPSDPERA